VNIKAVLVRNTVWYGGITLVGIGSGLLMSVVLARGLGPERMGDFSYVTWAWLTLEALATVGFATATARYTAQAFARGERAAAWGLARHFERRQLLATTLVVAVFTPVILCFAPPHLRWPMLVTIVALYPITAESIYTHALYGAQRYDATARMSALKMSLHVIVTVVALTLGAGIPGVIGGTAATLVVSCWLVRRTAARIYATTPADVPAPVRTEMRPYLLSLSIVTVLDAIVWERSEVFFLAIWGDARDIAYYSLAFGLATRAMLVPEIVVGALLPAFSALHGRGDARSFEEVYRTSLRYVALTAGLSAALVSALASDIVGVLYGEPYLPAAGLLSALAAVALVSALRQVAWAALPAVGDRRSALAATAVAAVVNIALAAWLIREYGTMGAVIANAAGQVLASAWVFVAMGRHHRCRLPWHDLLKIAGAASLSFITARITGASLDEASSLGRLILGAAAGSLVFLAACIVLRAIGLRELGIVIARTRAWASTSPET
jgi:O-antigen/teichoic acid export membrane protein